jgi:hypothetical protein
MTRKDSFSTTGPTSFAVTPLRAALGISQRLARRSEIGVDADDAVEMGQQKHFLDPAMSASDDDSPVRFTHGSCADGNHAHTSTVQKVEFGQIQDQLSTALLDEILDGLFNPLERIAQAKLTGEIHDGDAGFLKADIVVYDHACNTLSFEFMPPGARNALGRTSYDGDPAGIT